MGDRNVMNKREPIFLSLLILVVVVAGCRSTRLQPQEEYADTITHAGTITDLNRGDYAGFMAVSIPAG